MNRHLFSKSIFAINCADTEQNFYVGKFPEQELFRYSDL